MSTFVASLRRDSVRLALALVGLALVELLVRWSSSGTEALPVALLLLPVLSLALVAEGPATAVVAAAAIVLGLVEFQYGDYSSTDMRLRLAALVIGCCLGVGLATARSNREVALRRQAVSLESARARADAEPILQKMVERLPELSAAPDARRVAHRACVVARDLFGADTASYWHVDGDEAVLWARVPESAAFTLGDRQPRTLMSGVDNHVLSRTAWARLADPSEPVNADVMRRVGAAVGTSTPVLLAGRPIGYLTMSWSEDREPPDRYWLDAVDRYADQIALAKTLVRRRAAQAEAQRLARRFQASMLPELPEDGPVAVRALYRPGVAQMLLGGDFLDARVEPDGRVAFVLGDVAGHGPEQAALGATLRGAWRGLASATELTVEDWARSLNSVVREYVDHDQCLFTTAIMGHLDPATRVLTYVSAGHPPPLVLGGSPYTGPLGDPALGLVEEPKFRAQVLDLDDATAILVVTDGLFEGRRTPGDHRRFDHDSFVELLLERGLDDLDGPTYLNDLADEMERRHGDALPDDAAALLLRLEPEGSVCRS